MFTGSVSRHQQVAVKKHDNTFLSWRPRERPAGKKMQVNVKYCLPGITTVVDHHPIAVLIETLFFGNRLCNQEQMSYILPVPFLHTMNIGHVSLGHNKDMDRRLRVDVLERDGSRIFIDDLSGNTFLDDLAEEAAFREAHDHRSPFSEKLLKKQLLAPVWQAGPV